MPKDKRQLIYDWILRRSKLAMANMIADPALDASVRFTLINSRASITARIAGHLTEHYELLELFDIVEWKRERVRR